MTNAAQEKDSSTSLEELKQRFDDFDKLYQTIVNIVHSFPIDNINKVVIFHDFVSGHNHVKNYMTHVLNAMSKPHLVEDEKPEPVANPDA
jgi:hypothetical protein